MWLLGVLVGAIPFLTIIIVTFVFVPGPTTPRHAPVALLWRCKLWEFHTSIMGFVASNIIAFFFTQGMKNLFGKPRPDLLGRCQPDWENAGAHAVGGFAGESMANLLYSASICQQEDSDVLDDGFRSYPSGHSSASAAGLVYLSLFLASKFAVVIPQTQHNAKPQSLHNQAAAPPLYLLAMVLAPFALSVYISASRWFDFRHHGFDILFGYLIGLVAAVYCFYYYHLPISAGAGWAWGPRSNDRAFWVGVGRMGYTTELIEEDISKAEAGKFHGMDSNGDSNGGDFGHENASTHPSLSQEPTNVSDGDTPIPRNAHSYSSNAYALNGYARSSFHGPYDGAGHNDYFGVVDNRG